MEAVGVIVAKWKPVGGETWRKRRRRRLGRGIGYAPGRVYRAPIGVLDGVEVQTFGPGALYDSVNFILRDEFPEFPVRPYFLQFLEDGYPGLPGPQ